MGTITLNVDIDNGFKSKRLLAQLSEVLNEHRGTEITIDFGKIKFIAANQLSVLGALFDDFCSMGDSTIYVSNLSGKLKQVMQKNGFGSYIGLETMKDRFHTTIPYQFFAINESDEFERYLLMNIFQRDDIPNMSEQARNTIIDNILEVFNNVKEHTSSNNVYASGQFFPKSAMLYFTIADIGETIKDNVFKFFEHRNEDVVDINCIEWAMQEGNSTRIKGTPGGLGFSVLSRFVELNKGELSIVSDNECYEFNKGKYRNRLLDHRFRGTIVTVGINMKDTFSYLAVDNTIAQIIF